MPTQDRILTGSAPAGAKCVNKEKLEEGKAKRTANNERQKEIAEARAQKALEEKDRLGARTAEQVINEIEERAQKAAEQKRAREEKLAEEVRKLAPGRAGAGRVRIQSDASLRTFQWADNSR